MASSDSSNFQSKILIEPWRVNEYVQTYMGKDTQFGVSITPNAQVPVLDIGDLSQYNSRKVAFDEDRTLRTFLEMAITQFSINKFAFATLSDQIQL
jgi:hypothetical protein